MALLSDAAALFAATTAPADEDEAIGATATAAAAAAAAPPRVLLARRAAAARVGVALAALMAAAVDVRDRSIVLLIEHKRALCLRRISLESNGSRKTQGNLDGFRQK
jgi:hypothetical protein